MGFRSLQHMRNRRSTGRGRCLPATFRLQGLATLLTVSSLRSRAGSVSTRQRSWDSPFGAFSSREGTRASPPEWTHLPFRRRVQPRSRSHVDGPAGRGSWALTLPGVPGDRKRV